MTAREMFRKWWWLPIDEKRIEDLEAKVGYVRDWTDINQGIIELIFYKDGTVTVSSGDYTLVPLTKEILDAIQQQRKEFGWLDDKEKE